MRNTLTPRQWKLHDLLNDGNKHSVNEIIEEIPSYKNKFLTPHDRSIGIREDCTALNESLETDKIFGHDKDYFFFRCNKTEALEIIESLEEQALQKLKKVSDLRKKCKLDNQYTFIDRKNKVISEDSKARDYIETFKEK